MRLPSHQPRSKLRWWLYALLIAAFTVTAGGAGFVIALLVCTVIEVSN